MVQRTCERCGEALPTDRATAIYCSPRCRQAAYRERHGAARRAARRRPSNTGNYRWAAKIENISATLTTESDTFTDDELAEAEGAAEYLFYLLRGARRMRRLPEPGG